MMTICVSESQSYRGHLVTSSLTLSLWHPFLFPLPVFSQIPRDRRARRGALGAPANPCNTTQAVTLVVVREKSSVIAFFFVCKIPDFVSRRPRVANGGCAPLPLKVDLKLGPRM